MLIPTLPQLPYPVAFEPVDFDVVLGLGHCLSKASDFMVAVPNPDENIAAFVSRFYYVYNLLHDKWEVEDYADGNEAMILRAYCEARDAASDEIKNRIDQGMRCMFKLESDVTKHNMDVTTTIHDVKMCKIELAFITDESYGN